ncbi:hypothetical protein A2304_00360 [Candidatus Uhrbacteria bacterium RIFOXYB2_FULL_57_15]|uniref:Uncharacterized protein n=1 Tax=Candidatus Uhrbacteria bacterium RIFOXYB2_FULL_57_15 TaxID=1802422 RepID=A0A1F7W4F5_9BACT|nr:MAG: hypothetical protein A2304_00360 [Candidatus Uhrbacteria bacterium RIFOXYB2_FULL_57_15]OGM00042.1 MAG: hypothetical protein A2501_03775 [Candidatus Uhrbacteria bacterium RIFOXYC12_FULL_57_11]
MKRRVTQPVAGIGALIIALFFGTFVVLGMSEPEARFSISADGLAMVSGQAAPSVGRLSIGVSDDPGIALSSGVGMVYRSELGGNPLPAGFIVEISYDEEKLDGIAPNRLSAFAYDRVARAWIALQSVVDPAERTVTTESSGIDAIWWTLGAR